MSAARWLLVCSGLAFGCAATPEKSTLKRYRFPTPAEGAPASALMLAFSPDSESGGALSPDGHRLVYAADHKGQSDIWMRDLTTGEISRLTNDESEDARPNFSPDGQSIAFVSQRKDAKGDIFLWRAGKTFRLTDAKTTDDWPAFSPDGRWIYFATGVGNELHIERIGSDGSGREVVVERNSLQPALSPDGRFLAYTGYDPTGRAQVVLRRQADGREWIVAGRRYPAGYPAFCEDGQSIVFARFYRGPPASVRELTAVSSLFRAETAAVIGENSAAPLMQLTTESHSALMPRCSSTGILYTSRNARGLDLVQIPLTGEFGHLTAPELSAYALRAPNPWLQIAALRVAAFRAARFDPAVGYALAVRLRTVGELEKSANWYQRTAESDSDWGVRARIDALVADETPSTADRRKRDLKALPVPQRLRDYRELQVAALELASRGDVDRALETYRRISEAKGTFAAEAALRFGSVVQRSGPLQDTVRFYVELLDRFPAEDVQRRAASAISELLEQKEPQQQIEQYRALLQGRVTVEGFRLGRHLLTRRLGEIYRKTGRRDLALKVLLSAAKSADRKRRIETIFAIGEISLELARSASVGKTGLIAQALSSYRSLLAEAKPGSPVDERARREYRKLLLQEANRRWDSGEHDRAEALFVSLAKDADEMLQAHRGLIELAVARDAAEVVRLRELYLERYRRDSADFVANYALGYLQLYDAPLSAGALDRAESYLRAAAELRPRSPFPALTLGWINEFRERGLGLVGRSLLEEAILHYQRAHELNDADFDPRSEADILTNLSAVFIELGGNAEQANRYCRARGKLGLKFRTPAREAIHSLACGRAASALSAFIPAAERLKRAAELAEGNALHSLAVEAMLRLALNEHVRGDFEESNRLLEKVASLLSDAQARPRELAVIARTQAYNAVLLGDRKGARAAILRSRALLQAVRGVQSFEGRLLIATGDNPSTSPLGFSDAGEQDNLLALEEILAANEDRIDEQVSLLVDRLNARERSQPTPSAEQVRELVILRERLAFGFGQIDRDLDAIEARARARFDSARLEVSDPIAAAKLKLALDLNALQHLLENPQEDVNALNSAYQRLARYADAELQDLGERLALAVQVALAAAEVRLTQVADAQSLPSSTTPQEQLPAAFTAQSMYAGAVLRLGRVVSRLARSSAPEDFQSAPEDPLAELERPLSRGERVRWLVSTRISRALLTVSRVPQQDRAQHPALEELARAAEAAEAGRAPYLAALAKSQRALALGELESALEHGRRFLKEGPLLAEPAYLVAATKKRSALVAPLLAAALSSGADGQAVEFALLADERAVVDSIWQLLPTGMGLASEPLERLKKAAQRLRRGWHLLDPEQWNKRKEALGKAFAELEQADPRVAAALRPQPSSVSELSKRLYPGELAARIFVHDSKARLVYFGEAGEVKRLELGATPTTSTSALGQRRALEKLIAELVAADGPKRMIIDFGPIEVGLMTRITSAVEIVRSAGLARDLLARDYTSGIAQGMVSVGTKSGCVPKEENGQTKSRARDLDRLRRAVSPTALLVHCASITFDGNTPANFRLPLILRGTEPLRLARSLGLRIPAFAIAVTAVEVAPGAARERLQVLSALAHALGIANIVVLPSDGDRVGRLITALTKAGGRSSLASLVAEGALVIGAGALAPDLAEEVSVKRLGQAIARGAKAFKQRKLALAIDELELAVALMRALNQNKHLAGALKFLANAYGLAGDSKHAAVQMLRLLELRRSELEANPTADAKSRRRLADVYRQLAWLRLRSQDYRRGLEANERAQELYRALKLPDAQRAGHDQRRLIYAAARDRNGEMRAAGRAYRFAREADSERSTTARALTAAQSALEVARVVRISFANFGRASSYLSKAASHLPKLDLASLVLQSSAAQQPEQDSPAAKRIIAAQAEQRELAKAHYEITLERARLDIARGAYAAAIGHAKLARQIAGRIGVPPQSAQLEVVNALFYLGLYTPAIEEAEAGLAFEGGSPLREVQFRNAKGSALAALGDPTAESVLRFALAKARHHELEKEVLNSLNNLGRALSGLGKSSRAIAVLDRAEKLAASSQDTLGRASVLANRGLAYEAIGSVANARRDLQAARAAGKKARSARTELKSLLGLARLSLRGRELKSARATVREAIALADVRGMRDWLWRGWFLLGKIAGAAKNSSEAESAFRRALEVVRVLPPLSSSATELATARPGEVFRGLVALLAERGDPKALELAREHFAYRQRLSNGAMLREAVAAAGEPAPSILRELDERATLYSELATEKAESARSKEILEELDAIKGWLVSHRERLLVRRPALARALLPQVDSLASVQGRMSDGDARVLVLYPTERNLFSWLIAPDRVTHHASKFDAAALTDRVAALRRRLLGFAEVSTELSWFSEQLLAPHRKALSDNGPLWIAALGALEALPFAALPEDGRPLGVRRIVARVVHVAAPTIESSTPIRGPWTSFSAPDGDDWPIPFAALEASVIGRSSGASRSFLRDEATEANFLREAPGSRYLHLSSHFELKAHSPLESAFLLSGGRLTLRKLLGIEISALIGVLSTCGGELDGEDYRSPGVEAFQLAGTRVLLATLGRVSDLGMALLVKHWLRSLASGAHAGEALRVARGRLARRLPHPAFWAFGTLLYSY